MKILFICHGNICRSPMAEFIMKKLVSDKGLQDKFVIRSAATSSEEIGNPVYPDAKRMLNAHSIDCSGKRAVKLTRDDYNRYDLLVVMDENNLRNTLRIISSDPDRKVHKLMDYCSGGNVADPWYTGDFSKAYSDILAGCTALLDTIC